VDLERLKELDYRRAFLEIGGFLLVFIIFLLMTGFFAEL
jgi:hypothetical protein